MRRRSRNRRVLTCSPKFGSSQPPSEPSQRAIRLELAVSGDMSRTERGHEMGEQATGQRPMVVVGMQKRSWSPPCSSYVLPLIGPGRSPWLFSITVGVVLLCVFYHAIWNSGCGMCWNLEFGLGLTLGTCSSRSSPATATIYLRPHWGSLQTAD